MTILVVSWMVVMICCSVGIWALRETWAWWLSGLIAIGIGSLAIVALMPSAHPKSSSIEDAGAAFFGNLGHAMTAIAMIGVTVVMVIVEIVVVAGWRRGRRARSAAAAMEANAHLPMARVVASDDQSSASARNAK
jgi:hypothetical protein